MENFNHCQKLNSIKTPEGEDRIYDTFKMENGMNVILISDEKTERSAACVILPIGAMYDPEDTEGCAHFTEHLLFMGNEKYQDEDAFHKYITVNHGNRNGYTSFDRTSYFFDIPNKAFEGALDIFSGFFSHSLMKKESVDRELNAVNSEYEFKFTSDYRKMFSVLQTTMKKGHGLSKFATGNKKTLKKDNIRDVVLDFYNKFYSSNLMTLVLYGHESIEKLKAKANHYFKDVKNKNLSISKIKEEYGTNTCSFNSEFKKKMIKIVPSSDSSHVMVIFSFPHFHKDYKSDYSRIFSKLLGHEGNGSLFNHLKKQSLATELVAGPLFSYDGGLLLEVDITLAKAIEQDEEKVQEIVKEIFKYLEMLRKTKLEERKRFFEETKNLALLSFKYKEKTKESTTVMLLAENALKFDTEDLIYGDYLYADEFNNDLFNKYLDNLSPENSIVFWSSKTHEGKTDKVEKWYEGKYKVEDLPDHVFTKFSNHSNYNLPPKNIYVPKNFRVLSSGEDKKEINGKEKEFPSKVYDTEKFEVFFKQDNKFLLPKTNIVVQLNFLNQQLSAMNKFQNILVARLIKDSLSEILYPSIEAKMGFSISGNFDGFLLEAKGWSDTVKVLLLQILERIETMKIDEARFKDLKSKLITDLKNNRLISIISQAYSEFFHSSTGSKRFSYEDMLKVADDVTFTIINEFFAELIKCIKIQMLVIGNNKKEEVLEIVKEMEKILNISKKNVILDNEGVKMRAIKLPKSKKFVKQMETKNKKDNNNAVIYAVQIGKRSVQKDIYGDLFNQIVSSKFFNELRTKKQLGYVVQGFGKAVHNIKFFIFCVQSHTAAPGEINEAIEDFIKGFIENDLPKIEEKEFDGYLKVLQKRYVEKFKRLAEEVNFSWSEITDKQFNFDRRNYLSNECNNVSLKGFQDFVKTYFDQKNRSSHVVEVYKEGEKFHRIEDENIKYYTDTEDFKSKQSLYPHFFKY